MKRVAVLILLFCVSAQAGEFGYTTTGASDQSLPYCIADTVYATLLVSAAANTTVDSLSVCGFSTGGTGDVSLGVYDLADGSLVDSSVAITMTLTGVGQWETVACNISLTSGHTYFLAVGNEDGTVTIKRDTESNSVSAEASLQDLPATWNHSGVADAKLSMRGVYTTASNERKVGVVH